MSQPHRLHHPNSGQQLQESPSRHLVLGGKGFIGSHLVDALLREGKRVRCFDRAGAPTPARMRCEDIEYYSGDFTSAVDIGAALRGCDVVYHLISTTLPGPSNLDPVADVESNLVATLRFLNLAVEMNIGHVVFVSSGGTVYGAPKTIPIEEGHQTDPLCSYGISKLAIEKYLRLYTELHGLRTTTLRLSNPFGERQRSDASQGAIAVFLGRVLRNQPIEIWGDGTVIRDYLHISDVVAALMRAAAYRGPHHVFNVGSGKGTSLNELLTIIEGVTGIRTERRYLPARGFDVPANILAVARAANELDWSARISLEEGIDRTWKWMQEQPVLP